jgi:hypothetical protein
MKLTRHDGLGLSVRALPGIGAFRQNLGGAWQSITLNLLDSYSQEMAEFRPVDY